MLSIDLLGAGVLIVGIGIVVSTLRTLERYAREMVGTLHEVRTALEEMQQRLRTIDRGVADLHGDGRAVASALTQGPSRIAAKPH